MLVEEQERVGHLARVQEGILEVDQVLHCLELPLRVLFRFYHHGRVLRIQVDAEHLGARLQEVLLGDNIARLSLQNFLIELPALLSSLLGI